MYKLVCTMCGHCTCIYPLLHIGVPIIKSQSVVGKITVAYGGTITVSVSAECQPGPPLYQWFKDQKNILPGKISKTLLLHNASTNDTGTLVKYCTFVVYSLLVAFIHFLSMLTSD